MRDVETALDGAPDLITTSALLDLVSEDWLERLVVECAARNLPLYAALTYDGEVAFNPIDPVDRDVIGAVNRHQRGDKGFGPALGSEACDALTKRCKSVGYEVDEGQSDWIVGPAHREFQHAFLNELAKAAEETGDIPLERIGRWLGERRRLIDAAGLTLRVGHRDVFARPIGMR
jgi:hypothetical protein